MKVDRCAFELKRDRGVEFFNYETRAELLTLTGEQVRAFFAWWSCGSLALQDIVKQLKSCEYTCEAGPLELNIAFIALCELAEVSDG